MYKVGDKVEHTTFGSGSVVEVQLRKDGRPIIVVAFENDVKATREFTDVSLSEHTIK